MTIDESATARPEALGTRAWQTLFITSISMFLVAMDVTIVSVALPGIAESFDEPARDLVVGLHGVQHHLCRVAVAGRQLGDRWGRKPSVPRRARCVPGGIAHRRRCARGSVLIGARVLQAVGSALIYPASLALLLPEFPPSRRSMAIGVWGGVAGLGGAIAPTLGALLVEWIGLAGVFFINVPFVLGGHGGPGSGCCVSRRAMRVSDSFDPVAVPLAAVAVGVLVLGVVQGQSWGWDRPEDRRLLRGRSARCCRFRAPLGPASRTVARSRPVPDRAPSPWATSPRRCTSGRRSAGWC